MPEKDIDIPEEEDSSGKGAAQAVPHAGEARQYRRARRRHARGGGCRGGQDGRRAQTQIATQ